ncbi:helix-turn-helix domain-containing protein [Nocardia sp. NPDC051832]|uniref:TetR/AcrR family transcriptional regulator n=1 Tax=Nocardia sp. NPDC051832 TaxID=3155673 RepID=UPI00342EA474
MSVSKQETSLMKGRVRQKQRTRQALIDAARELARQGRALTIAEVAEAAQVSPATAYRYFSRPEELMREIAIAPSAQISDDLPHDPAERIAVVIDRLMSMQFGDEALWRAIALAAQERWFRQLSEGGEDPAPVRGQRRLEVTRAALAPLAGVLEPAELHRLTMAIMQVYGLEAMISAFDACGMEAGEARAVMQWSARTLLRGALAEAGVEPVDGAGPGLGREKRDAPSR